MNNASLPVEKSEILFLYESTYSIPNGDPFTGEQRYDEETKRVLVSDVRIKRFIRDHLYDTGIDIYVRNDRTSVKAVKEGKEGDAESGAAARLASLEKERPKASSHELLTSLIDVRLFGGISTKKGDAINLTGPVQFALLNPSLNAVDLRMHQNTSVFASRTDNTRGAIGTTTVVPYALMQIHGWVNPFAARHTDLAPGDLVRMFRALWDSINNANTRSKSNQSSLLLIQVVYTEANKKLYGLDRAIQIAPADNRREEQIRSRDDYELSLSLLNTLTQKSESVKEVRYHTEDSSLARELGEFTKFKAMDIAGRE